MDEWKRDRREYLRETADPAFMRMKTRTAKEQHADAMRTLRGPDDIPLPDADDSSVKRLQ